MKIFTLFAALGLISLSLSPASSSQQQNSIAPCTGSQLCAPRDTAVRPGKAPGSALVGLARATPSSLIDPDYGTLEFRVTDFNSSVHPGQIHMSSSASQNLFSHQTSPYLLGYITPGGGLGLSTITMGSSPVVSVKSTGLTAAQGTTFSADSLDFSYHFPGVFYSTGGSGSNWAVKTINSYTIDQSQPTWTSAAITPRVLLDPTSQCPGLAYNTPEFNRYNAASGGDTSASAGDAAGPGTGQILVSYKYQQNEATIIVKFDGNPALGPTQHCTWMNTRTGQFSIAGGPVQMITAAQPGGLPNGWTPMAPPPAPSKVTLSAGGSLPPATYNLQVTCTIAYTAGGKYHGFGETLPSPLRTVAVKPGSGTITTGPPSCPAGFVPATGYNVYLCNATALSACTPTLYSSLTPPTLTALSCVGQDAPGNTTTYTYYAVAQNAATRSSISAPAVIAKCPSQLTGARSVSYTISSVTGATSYSVMRDFPTVAFTTTALAGPNIDNGAISPVIADPQTQPLSASTVITSLPAVAGSTPPAIGTAGFAMHNNRMTRDGRWIAMAISSNAINGATAQVLWDTQVGNVALTTCNSGQKLPIPNVVGAGLPCNGIPAQINPVGGHAAFSYNQMVSHHPNYSSDYISYTLNDSAAIMLAGAVHLNPQWAIGGGGVDQHPSWANSTGTQSKVPFAFDNYIQSGSFAPPVLPWDGEVLMQPTDKPSLPYRICRDFTSGKNGFNSAGLGNISQDGKLFAFSTDMCRHPGSLCATGIAPLGCNDGTTKCFPPLQRTDVFVCEVK